jgi:1-acyl-sn-glycerol-3-phosphate acyltransferase
MAPKAGVALIAKAANADILPVCIYSSDESRLFTKLTVRFGKIIPYEELGITDSANPAELKEASRLIMNRITELWEEGHAD